MEIAKYVASLGLNIDKNSFAKADKELSNLEKKIKKLGSFGRGGLSFNIGNFSVDQRKLNRVLGDALDVASKQVKFEVSQFIVNDRNLQAALQRSARRVTVGAGLNTGGRAGSLTAAEWDRRQTVMGRAAIDRHQRQLELAALRNSRAGPSSSGRVGVAATGRGLGFSNFLAPALALGAGGYGLSLL